MQWLKWKLVTLKCDKKNVNLKAKLYEGSEKSFVHSTIKSPTRME